MGLSASQARLLTLTSRLNDVQYKQQQLANTKMRFSIESEEISQKYTNALSKQKFQFKNAEGKYQDMTLKAILNSGDYKLVHVRDGKKVVTNSNHGVNGSQGSTETKQEYYHSQYSGRYKLDVMPEDLQCKKAGKTFAKSLESVEPAKKAFEKPQVEFLQGVNFKGTDDVKFGDKTTAIDGQYTIDELNDLLVDQGERQQLGKALNMGRMPIWDSQTRTFLVPEDFHNNVCYSGFQYNTRLYNTIADDLSREGEPITGNGGNGGNEETFTIDAKFANDPNWLYEAIESGEFKLVDKNGNDINTTSSTDIDTVRDDSDEVKAKAEYDAAMNKINRKEKNIDNQMKMLDTTHSAVQQEIESVQNILSRHAEKDFNLFG